jgi:hypothetical protein
MGLRHRELRHAPLKAFVGAFPDAAFIGIPILRSLFGAASLYPILVLNPVALLIMVPLTTTLLNIGAGKSGGADTFASSVVAALRKPLVWVDQAIDDGHCHGRVGEDIISAGERPVRCGQNAAPLISLGDQLEQLASFGLILTDEGEVVEDDQIEMVELREHRRRLQALACNL